MKGSTSLPAFVARTVLSARTVEPVTTVSEDSIKKLAATVNSTLTSEMKDAQVIIAQDGESFTVTPAQNGNGVVHATRSPPPSSRPAPPSTSVSQERHRLPDGTLHHHRRRAGTPPNKANDLLDTADRNLRRHRHLHRRALRQGPLGRIPHQGRRYPRRTLASMHRQGRRLGQRPGCHHRRQARKPRRERRLLWQRSDHRPRRQEGP